MKIAVVTGASSGMGREFCFQLDKDGLDEIWAVALGKEELEELKSELKTPLRYFDMDLTVEKNLTFFKEQLEQTKATVLWLVNASGFAKFGRFDEIMVETSLNMIDLNCKALVYLTEVCLRHMIKGSKIVEFSSLAAFQPVPYIATYAATKAFVYSYARALREEVKPKGISVTAVCPFWTKTAFFNRAKKTNKITDSDVVSKYAKMYDPKKVIKKAYRDSKRGKALSIYGFYARSQTRLVKLAPTQLVLNTWLRQQKLKQKYEGK